MVSYRDHSHLCRPWHHHRPLRQRMAARGRRGAVRHAGAALARLGRTARGACGAVQQRGVLHHWRHDPGLWRGPLGHHGEGNAPHPARRRLQRAPPRQPRLGRGRGHLRLHAKHRRGGTLPPCPAPHCQTHRDCPSRACSCRSDSPPSSAAP